MKARHLAFVWMALLLVVRAALASTTWQTAEITGDPLFFQQDKDGAIARALLLRVPKEVPAITSGSREISYAPGRDFVWIAGTREVRLVKGSRIPFKTWQELHPPPESPHAYKAFVGGSSWLLYSQGRFFHDLQSVAAYTAADSWDAPRIERAPDVQLKRIRARLTAKTPIRLVVLGDSISTGLNASATGNAPPMQDGYAGLVARGLEERYGAKVVLRNLSVSGKSTPWAIEQMPLVVAESPDLFICAFGMNDASGRRTAEEFSANIRRILDVLRAEVPQCDVVLVAPMSANPEWTGAAPELYPAYAEVLEKLAGPGVAVANVTTVWSAILQRKAVLDLTGNGLNHPNDFGHRIYADVILDTIGR